MHTYICTYVALLAEIRKKLKRRTTMLCTQLDVLKSQQGYAVLEQAKSGRLLGFLSWTLAMGMEDWDAARLPSAKPSVLAREYIVYRY